MNRALCLVVAAVAALLLIAASPLTIPGGGHANVQIADGDAPGGG